MKELTIEQKAQRYDEALDRAKKLYEQGTITECLGHVFPELKESEDERVRKEIISAIKEDWPGHTDWIAWLEKQDEQKSTWSEEDVRLLNNCINLIEEFQKKRLLLGLKSKVSKFLLILQKLARMSRSLFGVKKMKRFLKQLLTLS